MPDISVVILASGDYSEVTEVQAQALIGDQVARKYSFEPGGGQMLSTVTAMQLRDFSQSGTSDGSAVGIFVILGLLAMVAVAIMIFRVVAFVITGLATMALIVVSAVTGISIIGILGGTAALVVSGAHGLPS